MVNVNLQLPLPSSGQVAEQIVVDYFNERSDCEILDRNFSRSTGEIDIVIKHDCDDGAVIVFVEVRYRKNQRYGHAAETVDYWKQKKLLATAALWRQQMDPDDQYPSRFDVVALHGNEMRGHDQHSHDQSLALCWLHSAFE